MASQEAWLEANSYSSNLLFKGSFFVIGIQVVLFFVFTPVIAMVGAAGLWLAILLFILFKNRDAIKVFSIN